ncbi:MAG: GntR family transcriptional regulator [Lachnospiraceae bacterium]|nr:GntR family transcriptional regulator [Lachnospiraceae bacterium]
MLNQLKFNSNEYLPLRDVVFNTLRQAIITGEFAPGERLMEIALAERLGVSRTPVREAIRKLELEGLVVMIPRKGAEVAQITEKDLRDSLEVRCNLEELAVKLACERITGEGEEKLKLALEDFKQAVEKQDFQNIVDSDIAFHDVIFEATQNHRLMQIASNLREQVYRYRVQYIKDDKLHPVLEEEHRMIVDYILKKDVQNAVNTMKKHIINQEEGVIKKIQAK